MEYAFYDGNFLPLCEVKIGVNDRSFFFGDGVYDAMVGAGDVIYMEEEHLSRFEKSRSQLSLKIPYNKQQIGAILRTLMKKAGDKLSFLYVQASRYGRERKHSPDFSSSAHFFAYAKPMVLPNDKEMLSLVTVEDTRYSLCHIKTINLLPNVLASGYAEERGADEAVFVKDGIVRECSHSNISLLCKGVLLTHPLDCHILPGIMRGALLREAQKSGIPIEEREYTIRDILSAEGVFITSTTRRVALAKSLDGHPLSSPSNEALSLQARVNMDFYEKMSKFY